MLYVIWYNHLGMEIAAEVAKDIEEAREIISHWIPNLDVGDKVKIFDEEDYI